MLRSLIQNQMFSFFSHGKASCTSIMENDSILAGKSLLKMAFSKIENCYKVTGPLFVSRLINR